MGASGRYDNSLEWLMLSPLTVIQLPSPEIDTFRCQVTVVASVDMAVYNISKNDPPLYLPCPVVIGMKASWFHHPLEPV